MQQKTLFAEEKELHFYSRATVRNKGVNLMDFFAHPSSFIDEGAIVGTGTKIWHVSHVMPGATIGQNCNIGQNVVVSPGVILGNGVKVQNNVSIYSGVICEDNVFLGPSMVFTNVINPRAFIERKNEFKTTLIKTGASIGANATIICGVTIGKYSLIGAGTVVSKDVPDYALVYGNPAKQAGWVCKCGTKLTTMPGNSLECTECGQKYVINNNLILKSND